jgi:hypothetical protein
VKELRPELSEDQDMVHRFFDGAVSEDGLHGA